jgi:5-(carboxyamino)imidazole ribonucleotide synthase
MNYFSSDFKLGILGGGQLGKMLLYETQKYDIYTVVLDPNDDAPCKIGCNEFVQGDLMDYDTVYNFGKKVTTLTLEIEHVNVAALEKLEEEGINVYPSSKTLRIIQNKAAQKLFYLDHAIPTPPFNRFAYTQEITTALKHEALSFPFVWKSSQFGYDGRGVKIVKTYSDLDGLPNIECITEKLILFKKELAIIVARNSDGAVKTYPLVEMDFHPEANQITSVTCPAKIEEDSAEKVRFIALKISRVLQHVGLLVVELFQTLDDNILVNEIALRPHNSGHYSIEASYTNQFEQHLRAILNLPLGKTDSKVAAIMVNLVGKEGYTGKVVYQNIERIMQLDGVTPHLYGKKETRPFRKMGHVTIVDSNMERAKKTASIVQDTIKVLSL